MRKRLVETLEKTELQRVRKITEGLMKTHTSGGDGYKDLAVFLAFLRATAMIHHTHHWQTFGDSFYADHLLLERLYTTTEEQVDGLAEKIVGLGSPGLTNYFQQTKVMFQFMKEVTDSSSPVLYTSIQAEEVLIAAGETISQRLEEQGLLTSGLANMLGDILDKHETHVYLLKQRLVWS